MKINSATPTPSVINNNAQKATSFAGKLPDFEKFKVLREHCGLASTGSLTQNLFIVNGFAFLLGGRIVTARDKDEKREILTRDIPSLILAVYGITSLEQVFAKKCQDISGFAIGAIKDKGLIHKQRLDVASSSQIKDWYVYDKNLDNAGGMDAFSNRLAKQGGNLKKIYSRLSDSIKSQLSGLSENNDTFIKELSQNEALKKDVKAALSVEKNRAFTQAAFLKVVPKIAGLGVTLAALGLFLPKLNIYLTEKINKDKKLKEEQAINA